jgi:hypothetical protein
VLAVHAKRPPARDENGQAGGGGQQLGDRRRGGGNLLDVVEDQQELAVLEELAERFVGWTSLEQASAGGLGHRRHDQRRIGERGEGNEDDPVREVGGDLPGDLDRQPGLADAAGSGQRHHRDVRVCQEFAYRRQLTLPPDQRRAWHRQIQRPRRCRGGVGDGHPASCRGGDERPVRCP